MINVDGHEKSLIPTRFIIISAGRTGSTRLRLLLDSHSMVRCHGEIFGENLTTLATPDTAEYAAAILQRQAAPDRFLQEWVWASGEHQAVGLKILYFQLFDQWPGLLDAVAEDRKLRIVHLVRNNGIKRFLSEFVVGTVTHKNNFYLDERVPDFTPIYLPPDLVIDNLKKIEMNIKKVRDIFIFQPFYEISYESIRDDNGAGIHGLLDFLGLPAEILSAPIQKIIPDDLKVMISNYDELFEKINGAGFGDTFDFSA